MTEGIPAITGEWVRTTAASIGADPLILATSQRFRQVSTAYAKRVKEAFEGDLLGAAACTDAQVAERVASWEKANRQPVSDWAAVGGYGEGDDYDDD